MYSSPQSAQEVSVCFPHVQELTPRWRFFTDDEATLMDAVAEQIIPSDDWPGGRESGVTNFIDKQLTGPHKRFRSIYRKGIAAIRKSCGTLISIRNLKN